MTLVYSETAVKQLKKLDKSAAKKIVDYMDAVAALPDPRSRGKALTANLTGLWRYRVEHYRIICLIEDEAIRILVTNIGDRKDIYKTR